MDYNRLKLLIERKYETKSEFVIDAQISRPTLDKILQGGDFKITTLEKMAEALEVPVGYFFDDQTTINLRKAGRDYHEHNDVYSGSQVSHGVGCDGSDTGTVIESLQQKIKDLESRLADKDLIIELLKKGCQPESSE
ncbi:MAG: helix-turn-helix domain-containing protein [Muribaculaceae bacterium]|nr:helix-turn-helix domain-containing protein [Muribaculaceae bacterium]